MNCEVSAVLGITEHLLTKRNTFNDHAVLSVSCSEISLPILWVKENTSVELTGFDT